MAVTNKPCVQQPQLGDFIRSTAVTPTRNRFQPLTLGVWQEIAATVKSTAMSAPQYVSPCQTGDTVSCASSDFPSLGHVPSVLSGTRPLRLTYAPPAPKGQGEIDGRALPAQANVSNSRGGYQHPLARPPHKYRTNIDNTCACAIDIEIDSPSIEKHASCLEKVGHGGLRKVSFLESRLGGGDGIGSRSGGGNGIDKEVEIDKEVDRTGGGLGDEYNDQDEGKGRRIEEGSRNGGGSDSSEEFGGMVGIARKVEGVTHEEILQALIFERRQYVNLMCKYPLTCKIPFTAFSSPLD